MKKRINRSENERSRKNEQIILKLPNIFETICSDFSCFSTNFIAEICYFPLNLSKDLPISLKFKQRFGIFWRDFSR